MFDESKIYQDTVEIVKSAVNCACEHNVLVGSNCVVRIQEYIQAVYDALTKINK